MIKKKLFIALCLLFISIMFSGCDRSIVVVDAEFGQFPRVVYIAGVDQELDFSDAVVIRTLRNGRQLEDPFPLRVTAIEHDVDFNTPGVYKVEVEILWDFHITFFVQVIDEEIFNELKSGVR